MSGGSYEYLYRSIEEAADRISQNRDPLYRAFAQHLRVVAKALHDIEWVEDCDYGPGDEHPAIKAALGKNWKARALEEIQAEIERLAREAREVIHGNPD